MCDIGTRSHVGTRSAAFGRCEQCGGGSIYIVRGRCHSCGWIQGSAMETELLAPL